MLRSLAFVLLVCISAVHAQTPPVKRIQLSQTSVVKDEQGTVYSYAIWSRLMSGGDYFVRVADPKAHPDSAVFVLVKRTEEQKNQYLSQLPKPNESTVFKVGDVFKPFKDRDINGEKFDLKQLLGKVVVLNFWFINCPPCRQEIPDLNELVNVYKDNKDVVFIAVALDEKFDIQDFIKRMPFNYHIIERGRFITDRYKLNLYPTNVVIDKEGRIAYSSVSYNPATVPWMKKTIDMSLTGEVKKEAAR